MENKLDEQVEAYYKIIKASNVDVSRFTDSFDWSLLPGFENKNQALRMSIVHALGEMNRNQEILFKTRNLNWDENVYNNLYKETVKIQRQLQSIISNYSIQNDLNDIKQKQAGSKLNEMEMTIKKMNNEFIAKPKQLEQRQLEQRQFISYIIIGFLSILLLILTILMLIPYLF